MTVASNSVARLLLNMPPGFEISGRLFWQAWELLGPNFFLLGKDQEKHDAFTNAVLDTMLKCHAMEYHVANFKEKEKRFLEGIDAGWDGIFRSHEMLFEFEAFLFQLKSALDIGVKIIDILLPGRFSVKTFRNKGEALRNGLNQHERDRSAKTDLAKGLQELLADDREAWLEQAIDLRDQIGHYKTFADFNYHAVTWRHANDPQADCMWDDACRVHGACIQELRRIPAGLHLPFHRAGTACILHDRHSIGRRLQRR